MEKTRNSNIELLRLVLMSFVVLLHFNNDTMGGAFVLVKDFPIENGILRMLEAFCACAVNCFMIVSGYFLFTNTKVRFGKILDILLIVIFYRFFDYFCRIIFLGDRLSIKQFIACFLPANYFAIFYVICYLFSPFIAKIFRESSDKSTNFLMAGLFIVFIIIPTLLDIANDLHIFNDHGFLSPISVRGNGGGDTIVQFFVMLCFGMWIRKTEINPKTWILMVVYAASSVLIAVMKRKINTYNYDFVLNVLNAAVLFLLFNKMKFQSKAINFTSKSCFAIYCIHTGGFANTLWTKFFIIEEHFSQGIMNAIIWILVCVGTMFGVCLAISFLMRFLFGNVKPKLCEKMPEFCMNSNSDSY
ncbi:MAG: acyltransferase [Treponema sp.]